jgi:hypothetical protein
MFKKLTITGLSVLLLAAVAVTTVSAATTVTVTPSDTQGWSTSDTRPGGSVTFVAATSSPFGDGALNLTTNASTTAKAQYLKSVTSSTTLADVTELAYSTQRVSGPDIAAASYQLIVDLNGATTSATSSGFTTFVYEPYQNGTVDNDDWQTWDVDAGQMWSSRTFSEGTCSVTAGGGGAPFYTLADLKEDCPNAVVLGFGVNIGSNNPSYNVNTDGVVFNGTTYDFELATTSADTTAPAAPTPVSPSNGATVTSDDLDKVDWTTVTDPSSPVTYMYQASHSSATNPDGSFTTPVYTSGSLSDSEIATPGTPEGLYYWHVKATDAVGNSSPWSVTWSFTVDNSSTTTPPTTGPTNKDQCKKDGWKTFTNPSFKNQGQCVSSVTSHR